VERVFLPTYASWLNWIIEPEFAALRYFAATAPAAWPCASNT
jgi:hypothetical protein